MDILHRHIHTRNMLILSELQCWTSSPKQQQGGEALPPSTWLDCRGRRNSTSARKRYSSSFGLFIFSCIQRVYREAWSSSLPPEETGLSHLGCCRACSCARWCGWFRGPTWSTSRLCWASADGRADCGWRRPGLSSRSTSTRLAKSTISSSKRDTSPRPETTAAEHTGNWPLPAAFMFLLKVHVVVVVVVFCCVWKKKQTVMYQSRKYVWPCHFKISFLKSGCFFVFVIKGFWKKNAVYVVLQNQPWESLLFKNWTFCILTILFKSEIK